MGSMVTSFRIGFVSCLTKYRKKAHVVNPLYHFKVTPCEIGLQKLCPLSIFIPVRQKRTEGLPGSGVLRQELAAVGIAEEGYEGTRWGM